MAQAQSNPNDVYERSVMRSPSMDRQSSAWYAEQSDNILEAVESRNHAKLRETLVSLPTPCRDEIVLAANISSKHRMRTPMMAAAGSGDLAIFATVANAVNKSIEQQVMLDKNSEALQLEKYQVQCMDDSGMTLMLIAAESGNVGILEAVLRRVRSAEDPDRLLDADYNRKSVLMHAAGGGRSALFNTVIDEISRHCPDEKVQEQLLAKSGDGRTILMHAVRCGDQMCVLAAKHASQKFLNPQKVRHHVKEVDDEGMTFLMHAASGSSRMSSMFAPAKQGHDGNILHGTPSTTSSARDDDHRQQRLDEERGGRGGHNVGGPKGDVDGNGSAEMTAIGGWTWSEGAMDPGVVVFKVAWSLVKEVLWKEQIREQLKATDAWGRSLLTHAILSGRIAIFDVTLCAIREYVLDDEVHALLGIDTEDDTQTVMEAALEKVSKEMAMRVSRRDQEVKKAMALQAKMSSIEASIQSFIPGKLIVMFQMLLPVVGGNDAKLMLLVVMACLAPILSWARSLVAREESSPDGPSSEYKRRSLVSLLLSAPSMFFWGLGTSNIAQDNGMGWSESTTAAALAVATIVIPAIDAFFASQKVRQWYDEWSCQRWRFSKRADRAWKKEQGERLAAAAKVCGTSKISGPLSAGAAQAVALKS